MTERIGLLNQSTFDDSYITEQPSMLVDKSVDEGQSNTGKWKNAFLNVPKTGQESRSSKFKQEFVNKSKDLENYVQKDQIEEVDKEDMSFASKESMDKMTTAQIEVFSAQMNREQYYLFGKAHSYMCLLGLILISISSTMQRSAISFMYAFQDPQDESKTTNKHYNIGYDIPGFTPEKFDYIAGDAQTIIYAFLVLFLGSASDMFNRKNVILGTCFGWSLCTYLSSFALTFNQIFILRCLKGLFMAVSGPCSYSLITDWVPPENRLTAYSIYSLGVQFGGPFASLNSQLIDWLGWRATFQYNALIGFIILGLCIVIFDEPEKGRFDIAHSVVNNPEESMKNDSIGYALSEAPTRKRLDIQRQEDQHSWFLVQSVKEYLFALRELFVNDTANWILLAACLRTQQGIAMGLFTQQYFLIYPGREDTFSIASSVSGLIGAFICTMATGLICDRYDNYNYMTKAYICIFCTTVSIPCCMMIYLCTTNFWVSMTGLFIEYLLSTGWGQPAIGILSTVCDPSVRGTAVSVFFFLITIFGVIAPKGFAKMQDYYGLDPLHEPKEFGYLVALCTIIPCILALPCFYIAGVKYSWYKYHEAMFMLDVWGEMEQWYQDDISKKRFYQHQIEGNDPQDFQNLSVSVDWQQLKQQRKMKVKDFKKDASLIQNLKPTMKKRNDVVDQHGEGLVKRKTIIANLAGDESVAEFPDTTSQQNDQSYQFQQYAQSYDQRDSFL